MRSFFVPIVVMLVLLPQHDAKAVSAIYCGNNIGGAPGCVKLTGQSSQNDATENALNECRLRGLYGCTFAGSSAYFTNQCRSVAAPPNSRRWFTGAALTIDVSEKAAIATCERLSSANNCAIIVTLCDNVQAEASSPQEVPPVAQSPSPTAPHARLIQQPAAPLNPQAPSSDAEIYVHPILRNAWTLMFQNTWALVVIGLAAWVVFAAVQLFIHENLPHTLINYGEDIEVLFTRTQRVNWYGRVVFGVVARLAMTEQQLLLVRRYRLGRVIAFDSFRRQRQSQLAKFHLQLAAAGNITAIDARTQPLFWIVLKRTLFAVFYALRALISLLLGFFFLRVTIASLARGKLIETKDLTLMLEAKDAIEETASYLKEYLEVAETFDGREELFEPEGPFNAVLEALYGRREAQPQGNARPLRRGREALSS